MLQKMVVKGLLDPSYSKRARKPRVLKPGMNRENGPFLVGAQEKGTRAEEKSRMGQEHVQAGSLH